MLHDGVEEFSCVVGAIRSAICHAAVAFKSIRAGNRRRSAIRARQSELAAAEPREKPAQGLRVAFRIQHPCDVGRELVGFPRIDAGRIIEVSVLRPRDEQLRESCGVPCRERVEEPLDQLSAASRTTSQRLDPNHSMEKSAHRLFGREDAVNFRKRLLAGWNSGSKMAWLPVAAGNHEYQEHEWERLAQLRA